MKNGGLGKKFLRCTRAFLRSGGVALRDRIQLVDRRVDQIDTLALFLGCQRDLGDKVVDLPCLSDNGVEAIGDLSADFGSGATLADRLFNDLRRFLGSISTAAGEVSDFVGNDSEPKTRFSSASCFHRRVEGQDVCLESDLVNRPDDFCNLVTGLINLGHGSHHVLHFGEASFGSGAGKVGGFLGLLRVLGIPLGDRCTIEAGLYVTAGTKVTLLDNQGKEAGTCKARELSGKSDMLFRRNSVTGRVECLTNKTEVELNAALHSNN